jgi:hypothetical protein
MQWSIEALLTSNLNPSADKQIYVAGVFNSVMANENDNNLNV